MLRAWHVSRLWQPHGFHDQQCTQCTAAQRARDGHREPGNRRSLWAAGRSHRIELDARELVYRVRLWRASSCPRLVGGGLCWVAAVLALASVMDGVSAIACILSGILAVMWGYCLNAVFLAVAKTSSSPTNPRASSRRWLSSSGQ